MIKTKELYPVEKITHTFLESKEVTHREILSKFYKLGTSSKSEEEKKQLLKRKLEYYNKLDIVKIKIGVDSFEGYLGLCLKDGTVILDKLFENVSTGLIATNQAIYLTDESEFEKVTSLAKKECIEQIKQGKIKAKRIIHRGSWEDRIKKET